MIIQTVT